MSTSLPFPVAMAGAVPAAPSTAAAPAAAPVWNRDLRDSMVCLTVFITEISHISSPPSDCGTGRRTGSGSLQERPARRSFVLRQCCPSGACGQGPPSGLYSRCWRGTPQRPRISGRSATHESGPCHRRSRDQRLCGGFRNARGDPRSRRRCCCSLAVNMLSLVRVQRGDGSRAGPWQRRGILRCSATWFPGAGKLAGRQPLAKSGWLLLPYCARRCGQAR